MSPILVRPVREQLEHDRIIRILQTKFRRRYEAGINPGAEQNAAVGTGPAVRYPDLVLLSLDRGHRLQVVVEVETGESVNHLEALAEWAHFSKLRAAFHLYVPAGMVDVARRLCDDNRIYVSEIWSYHTIGDQPRFTLVHRNREQPPQPARQPRALERDTAAQPKRDIAAQPKRDTAAQPKRDTAAQPTRRKAPSRSAKSGATVTKKPARAQKRK